MSKNTTALILIVLAIGIYFTFTKGKIADLKTIQNVNAEYQKAIDNSIILQKKRDQIIKEDINISEENNIRLNKILPDNVDNVRLIIDVKDNIAASHRLFLKGIKTSSPTDSLSKNTSSPSSAPDGTVVLPSEYGTVTLSFSVTTQYQTFLDFIKDLEASLRLMDISRLTVSVGDNGLYNFNVEIKTYWLKQ